MIGLRKKRSQITLSVAGIRCNHCESSIKLALGKTPGVRRVQISKREQVVVEFDPTSQVSGGELISIIEKAGYRVIYGPKSTG